VAVLPLFKHLACPTHDNPAIDRIALSAPMSNLDGAPAGKQTAAPGDESGSGGGSAETFAAVSRKTLFDRSHFVNETISGARFR
jgi:hypothetical protein